MSRIRLLHVITQLERGGAQRMVLELLRRIDVHRYDVTLATSPGGPLEAEARAIPGLTVKTFASLQRPIHPWRDLTCALALSRFIRTHRFDLVHTHSSKAGILGRWAAHQAGVPVICHTIHGFAFHPFQSWWLRCSYQWAERAAARYTTRLISISHHDYATGLSHGIGAPAQYRLIPYGIDGQRFHRNGLTAEIARRQLGLAPAAPTIGTIACFKPQKALHDFIAVCARLRQQVPTLQCLLVGDGVLRPQIERWRQAEGLEGCVHLLGWRTDIPVLLSALDVFVLTSRWEGLPVAVLEAEAMGVPVVATDTGGVRDCVEHGVTGFLAPIGDVSALTACVVDVLRDPAMAASVGARSAVSAAQTFPVERMVERIQHLYDDALTQKGLARSV